MFSTLLFSLRLTGNVVLRSVEEKGTLSACFSTVSRVNCHRRICQSSTLFLTQPHDQQDQQMVSRRPRTEGSARVRPSLRRPLSVTRDFWTQENGHPATAHSPSKTETELSYPTNATGTHKKYTPHTLSIQFGEKITVTRHYGLERWFPDLQEGKGKEGGGGDRAVNPSSQL